MLKPDVVTRWLNPDAARRVQQVEWRAQLSSVLDLMISQWCLCSRGADVAQGSHIWKCYINSTECELMNAGRTDDSLCFIFHILMWNTILNRTTGPLTSFFRSFQPLFWIFDKKPVSEPLVMVVLSNYNVQSQDWTLILSFELDLS